jgi:hypothetical protein
MPWRKITGFKCLLILSAISICFLCCGQYRRLYRAGDKGRYQTGKLEKPVFDSLKQYLFSITGKPVNDTIIIKFDFNHETCWSLSDSRTDAEIDAAIARVNEHQAAVLSSRKQLSVFLFRETGRDFNKLISRNNTILIDNGFMEHLLFKQKTVCGTSAILDPSGSYLLVRSDSHFEALHMTAAQFASFF